MLIERRWLMAPTAVVATFALAWAGTPAWGHEQPPGGAGHGRAGLPLGPGNLPEQRVVTQIAPGLALTTITRGRPDPATQFWTIAVNMPLGVVAPDPDPDADAGALGPLEKAQTMAAQISANPAIAPLLAERGWQPRVEPVDYVQPLIDYPGGLIGYTLRVGRFDSKPTSAIPLYAAMAKAGFKVFAVHTGQDGRPDSSGPWVVRVLTVDFHSFHGKVKTSVGSAVSGQETTTAIARKENAVFATNGGFFTINTADGTLGVPAGLTVLNGTPVTAATNGRAALVLGDYGRDTRVEKLSSRYSVRFTRDRRPGQWHTVDGLNRPAGLIRNCGGVGGDTPTQRPVMDFTCKDTDEMVVLTPEYGAPAPTGPGVEALIDRRRKVVAVRTRTGEAVPPGDSVVQATGSVATWLSANAKIGSTMATSVTTADDHGRAIHFGHGDYVVNGGPQLLSGGRLAVDPDQDGLLHEDPALGLPDSALGASYGYGWFVRDNPRTAVGVDRRGRLLIVQADGRQEKLSQGLTIRDLADVMQSLGAVEAINLDGGGSSASVLNDQLISSPSDTDAQGHQVERSVGDALIVTQ